MRRFTERDILAWLHGELDRREADAFEQLLAHDSELAARCRELQALWQDLEPPAPRPLPLAYKGRVLASIEAATANDLPGWKQTPVWARTSAAIALFIGVLAGAGLGAGLTPDATLELDSTAATEDFLYAEEYLSLAETYWLGLEETPDAGGAGEPTL